jgi:hypothetical protein
VVSAVVPVVLWVLMWSILGWFAVLGHHRGYRSAVAVYTPGVFVAVVVVASPFLVAAAGRWPSVADGALALHDRWVNRLKAATALWGLTQAVVLYGAVYAADGDRPGALAGYAFVSVLTAWWFAPTRFRVRHDIASAARHGLDLAAVVFAPSPRRPSTYRFANYPTRRRH